MLLELMRLIGFLNGMLPAVKAATAAVCSGGNTLTLDDTP